MMNHNQRLFHAFGPYAKGYMGYSHLPFFASEEAAHPAPLTMAAAARLDCVVVPALHSQPTGMPNTTRVSGCHPWLATSPDLSQVQYRYELGLGPSEAAYAQVTYARLDDHQVLIHTRFVNNTERTLDAVLNYFLGLHLPHPRVCRVRLAPGTRHIPGEARLSVQFAVPRPWDCQQPDAFPSGVFRDPAFTDGFGFGDRVATGHVPHLNLQPWAAQAGDSVAYDLGEAPQGGEALAIRYRTVPRRPDQRLGDFAAEALGSQDAKAADVHPVRLALSGCAAGDLTLPPREDLGLVLFEGLSWQAGSTLQITSLEEGSGLEIDCLLLGPRESLLACAFEWEALMPAPLHIQASPEGYVLSFPAQDAAYRLLPLDAVTRQRLLDSGTLEDAEPMRYSNPHFTFDDLQRPFSGSFARKHSTQGQWFNAIQPGILVPPGQHRDCHALLIYEGRAQPAFPDAGQGLSPDLMAHVQGLHTGQRAQDELIRLTAHIREQDSILPRAPREIRQGMGLLKATLLQNLVYPIYTKQGWICHFTPGKRWDNLYTWDGGFIALGLLTARRELAEYMLDCYLAPMDDPEQAFVHHGSPVPVQYMVLREMLAGQEAAEQLRLLDRFYHRTRQFYLFLTGRTHASTTNPFATGLLTTYDYFYSVSGMDDYPPQLMSHLQGIANRVSPVITSAQAILGARTLALLASRYEELTPNPGLAQALSLEIQGYLEDAARLEQALKDHAWDEDSGYFGYVLHDEQGQKTGLLRHPDGSNLNRGLDGIYPLVAGGGLAPHQDRLLSHLKNDRALLTPWGLTAVDQSAPYASTEGYWNGGVWYPHAWYVGRALLDCGEGPFLLDLLHRQLMAWSRQACARWHSFEMLRVASGEGAWHFSFSGLTSPLLNWAHSLYQPGTITTGLGALLISRESDAQGGLLLHLRKEARAPGLQLMACLDLQEPPPCRAFLRPPIGTGHQDVLVALGKGITAPKDARELPCSVDQLQPGLFLISLGP